MERRAAETPVDRPDYRDIAVLVVAEPPVAAEDRFRIPGLTMKALQWKGGGQNWTSGMRGEFQTR